MDPIYTVMLDVARIVTFQPTPANTETRSIAHERELRSTDAATADEWAPAAARATKPEPVRLRRWFRFSLMPR
jgi:hypothetical protein